MADHHFPWRRSHSWLGLRLGLLLVWVFGLPAQGTRSWNGSAPSWQDPAAWTPAGVPAGLDFAAFTPQTGSGPLPTLPRLDAAVSLRGLLAANGPTGDAFALTGNAHNLLLATGTGQPPGAAFVVRGSHPQAAEGAFSLFGDPPAPFTLRRLPLLQIGSAANPTPGRGLDLGHQTALGLTDVSIDLQNETLAMHGAALVLADTRGLVGGGPATLVAGAVELAGGTNLLSFRSSESGEVSDFAPTDGALRLASGYGRVRLEFGVGLLRLRFGRLEQEPGVAAVNFEVNQLGGAAEISFLEAPALTNGVISTASGGAHRGWAIFNGDQFATYAGSVGPIVPLAAQGDLSNPALPASANLDLVSGSTIAAGTVFRANTVRLGNAALLELGPGAQLEANALLLPFASSCQVTGGALTGTATRYFHVQDPGAPQQGQEGNVLAIESNLALPAEGLLSAPGWVKSGPGFLVLTGASDQVAIGLAEAAVTLAAGTLRARLESAPPPSPGTRPPSFGFGTLLPPNFGASNLLQFRGGVLEAAGADRPFGSLFARALGEGLGEVNWARLSPNGDSGGSGGFSALGGILTVALQVGGVPSAPLQWDATPGFVRDGHALVFGSAQTDGSPVVWTNPIALDGGLAGTLYRVRELEVLAARIPVGDGDLQVIPAVLQMRAALSGSGSTDLLKTGFGRLELLLPNPYAGQTLVLGGTLRAAPLAPGDAVLAGTSRLIVRGPASRPTSRDGARLELGASDQINDGAPLVLADGGTFAVNGWNETLGPLTVAEGPSLNPAILDLGELAPDLTEHAVRFAASAHLPWTGHLQVWNWTGDPKGERSDRIYFGSDGSGLTPAQLKSISFFSDEGQTLLGRAAMLPTGEIVPAPLTPAPILLIVPGPAAGQATLRWLAAGSTGFLLERNETLAGPWVVEPTLPVLNGAHFEVIADLTPPRRFFRLRR